MPRSPKVAAEKKSRTQKATAVNKMKKLIENVVDDDEENQILQSFFPKKTVNKRKQISSKLKDNTVITSDKDKTVDSDEETNKQKLSDDLNILEISKQISEINVVINSKKRIEISSAEKSNIDIVEDKDKSPTLDEPVTKSIKSNNNIDSDYYCRNKEKRNKIKKENYQNRKEIIKEKSNENYQTRIEKKLLKKKLMKIIKILKKRK